MLNIDLPMLVAIKLGDQAMTLDSVFLSGSDYKNSVTLTGRRVEMW